MFSYPLSHSVSVKTQSRFLCKQYFIQESGRCYKSQGTSSLIPMSYLIELVDFHELISIPKISLVYIRHIWSYLCQNNLSLSSLYLRWLPVPVHNRIRLKYSIMGWRNNVLNSPCKPKCFLQIISYKTIWAYFHSSYTLMSCKLIFLDHCSLLSMHYTRSFSGRAWDSGLIMIVQPPPNQPSPDQFTSTSVSHSASQSQQ